MEQTSNQATIMYIKSVLRKMEISPSALAKLAGVSPTTITRPLNNPDYKFSLSATTLAKIAEISGINPGRYFYVKDDLKTPEEREKARTSYRSNAGAPMPREVHSTKLLGLAALGAWYEPGKINERNKSISITSSHAQSSDCFVVLIKDDHAEDYARAGEYLFCLRYSAFPDEPQNHTIVVLERRRDKGSLIELTARRMVKEGNRWNLLLVDDDPIYDDVVSMDAIPEDGDATILGRVVYVVRQGLFRSNA